MNDEAAKALRAYGFLTVLEDSVHGAFGGYLVLSPQGRPLEFRCSTPVKPSRAQEILYGPALRPYLWGEVVGQRLVESAQISVAAILTDRAEMLAMALLRPEEVLHVAQQAPEEGVRVGGNFEARGRVLHLAPTSLISTEKARQLIGPLLEEVDPWEPFERIRLALCEVGQLSRDPEKRESDGGMERHGAAA